jgi:hypothetical protein
MRNMLLYTNSKIFRRYNVFQFTSKIKVYTKTGDAGTTSLIGGIRKNKDEEIFEILGDIDELSSYLGIVK